MTAFNVVGNTTSPVMNFTVGFVSYSPKDTALLSNEALIMGASLGGFAAFISLVAVAMVGLLCRTYNYYEAVCSGGCRRALDKYKNEVVNYWAGTSFESGPEIGEHFEACEVDLPNKCTRNHPPKEFLECAQNSADAGWVGSAHFFIINGLKSRSVSDAVGVNFRKQYCSSSTIVCVCTYCTVYVCMYVCMYVPRGGATAPSLVPRPSHALCERGSGI